MAWARLLLLFSLVVACSCARPSRSGLLWTGHGPSPASERAATGLPSSAWLDKGLRVRGGGRPAAPAPRSVGTKICEHIIATRPWSWTAGIVPVILTATLLNQEHDIPVFSVGLLRSLVLVVFLQASGNLVNSCIDFNQGVDKVDTAGDRAIVDNLVTPKRALVLASVLFLVAVGQVVPAFLDEATRKDLLYTGGLGLVLTYGYTAWPLRLKYRALGDLTVFALFGPMLMRVAALLISGEPCPWLLPYSIPVALLCEAILHANNTRDIMQDRAAGISTLASVVGYRASQWLYYAMVLGAYASAAVLAAKQFTGMFLVLLTLPIAFVALKGFQPLTMQNMDERTAKLHLPFGILMCAGVMLTGLLPQAMAA